MGPSQSWAEPGSYFPSVHLTRGQGVCELRSNGHSTVAAGQDGPLPVQCLWSLSQDEWAKQAPHPTQEAAGKATGLPPLTQGSVLTLYMNPHSPSFPIPIGTQLCTGAPIFNLPSQAVSRNTTLSLHSSFHPWFHTGITLGPSPRYVD